MLTITQEMDAEREDCERHMAALFGATLTVDQIRVGTAMWLERAKLARAAAKTAAPLARQAAERTGEEVLPEHRA